LINKSIYRSLLNKVKGFSGSNEFLVPTLVIIFLFTSAAYSVYFAPAGVDRLFFVVLLVLFWYSKSDYLWFAFFIIVSSYPGGLFAETSSDAARRLPIFTILPRYSFSVMDLFLITALFKAFLRGKKSNLLDVFRLKNIIYIFPYIVLVSVFYGVTLKVFLNSAARGLFFYTLVFSFPALIYTKKDIYRFMSMFFPFVILEVMAQLFYIQTGMMFVQLFNPEAFIEILNSVSGGVRAIPSGFINVRLAFVFAFVLIEVKEKYVPNFYSYLIVILSLISVIVSATRSAIIMFLFILISYFVFVARKRPNIFINFFIFCVVFIMVLDTTEIFDLNTIFGSSYNRFVGAVSVDEGSIKAEDSFDNRISNRFPVLWENINNSIFLGYGFSDKYFFYYDGHLGGVLVGLLQVGVFGFTLYAIFIVNIFRKCFWYLRKIKESNSFHGIIKVITIGFSGYLIINFTVDPIFVLNTSTLPQDIFIHLVIASFLVNMAIREQVEKRIASRELIQEVA